MTLIALPSATTLTNILLFLILLALIPRLLTLAPQLLPLIGVLVVLIPLLLWGSTLEPCTEGYYWVKARSGLFGHCALNSTKPEG
jgi:hypothetical protein